MPNWVENLDEVFALEKHAILELNTEDRVYIPDEKDGPANLNFFLANRYAGRGYRIAQYTPSLGIREMDPDKGATQPLKDLGTNNDPLACLNTISNLLRSKDEKWLVIILHIERLAPARGMGGGLSNNIPAAEVIHNLGLDDGIAAGKSRIVGICYTSLPEELIAESRGFEVIQVGLPGPEEREAFIDFIEEQRKVGDASFGQVDPDLDRESLVKMTAGLPLSGIESLHRKAAFRSQPITRKMISQEKAKTIRRMAGSRLEVSEPTEGFESVAGLKTIVAYLLTVIEQIKFDAKDVPQAIIIHGVPGCGKNNIVRALANAMDWMLIELRCIRDMYVGNSERNLERVIQLVEQLCPAIVCFDEIDQLIGEREVGPSGNSGVENNLFARILSWMGDMKHRGRILFIGLSNRPDALDTAFVDRYGVSIPVLKPGREEIIEMIPLFLNKFDRSLADELSADLIRRFVEISPTGRDLQEILGSAGRRADYIQGQRCSEISLKHLEYAIHDHICREDRIEMDFISLTSLSKTNRQSLLPWNGPDGLREGAIVPGWLLDLGVVRKDGRLVKDRLTQALKEIKNERAFKKATR